MSIAWVIKLALLCLLFGALWIGSDKIPHRGLNAFAKIVILLVAILVLLRFFGVY